MNLLNFKKQTYFEKSSFEKKSPTNFQDNSNKKTFYSEVNNNKTPPLSPTNFKDNSNKKSFYSEVIINNNNKTPPLLPTNFKNIPIKNYFIQELLIIIIKHHFITNKFSR